jgi:hypothetical protein
VDRALAQAVDRDAVLVGAGLPGQESHGGFGAAGVDGAAHVGRATGVGPQSGLAGAHLVVAQRRDAVVGQILGELAHVADRSGDVVVTVAVGAAALGDQQGGRAGAGAVLMPVGAVHRQPVGDERDLVFDPRALGVAV